MQDRDPSASMGVTERPPPLSDNNHTPSPKIKAVLDEFEARLKELDIHFYIVGNSGVDQVLPGRNGFRYTNWPASLLALWAKHQGFSLDPIVQHSRKATKPFFWREAGSSTSKFSKKLLEVALQHGLCEGYVVPMRDEAGNLAGAVSLGGAHFSFPPETLKSIEEMCLDLIRELNELVPAQPPVSIDILTLQEREVLQCAAIGCSIREIGEVIGISSSAVKDAQLRARSKLGARNTTHACVIATRLRII